MICIASDNLGPVSSLHVPGSYVRAVILASDTPASLTIDGSDVDGLDDADILAPGSIIIAPSKNYIAFEEGVFTEKG